MPNHTLFLSDLHLQDARPELTELFRRCLEKYAPNADAIYILGDLFELWIGDDDKRPYNQRVIQIIKAASDHCPVYLMAGNRDILLGQRFAKACSATLLKDPTVIDLYGERVLLAHGDAYCTDDEAHMNLRRYTLNPIMRFLFCSLPLSLRLKIANWGRQKSKRRTSETERALMDVNEGAIRAAMQKAGVSKMIHGHTHRPKDHGYRVVLGDWHQEGAYIGLAVKKTLSLFWYDG